MDKLDLIFEEMVFSMATMTFQYGGCLRFKLI